MEGRAGLALSLVQVAARGDECAEAIGLLLAALGQWWIGNPLTHVGEGIVKRLSVPNKKQIHFVLEALRGGE
jgi:hypothetical protein